MAGAAVNRAPVRGGASGQGGLELCYFVIAIVVALVAMTHYVRMSVAGRIKTGADSVSQTLFNTEGADITFMRCQNSLVLSRGTIAGAVQTNGASLSAERIQLAGPVAAYQLNDCPP